MSARWESAVDDLISFRSQARNSPEMWFLGQPDRPGGKWWRGWDDSIAEIRRQVDSADPVYVDEDVFGMFQYALEGFAAEPLLEADVFTQSAFLVLPERIKILKDPNEEWPATSEQGIKGVSFQAILWRAAGDGMHVSCWMRTKDFIEASDEPDVKIPAGASWIHTGGEVIPWGSTPSPPLRPVQALWRLASSLVHGPEQISRGARRRLQRLNLDYRHVTVVRLRRARYPRHGESQQIDWSCRWLVRGHWRTMADGRQTFIAPYVKGPDDKPFRVSDRVFEFVR